MKIRDEFSLLNGGENMARKILSVGLHTFKQSNRKSMFSKDENSSFDDITYGIRTLAHRIYDARNNNRPFKVSLSGSPAVTVKGNYYYQAFPSLFEGILSNPMKLLGVEIEVHNAAISYSSSFPYGWCLNNFLGWDVDIVSWGSGMSSHGDSGEVFESFLRNTLTLERSPMLIVLERSPENTRNTIL